MAITFKVPIVGTEVTKEELDQAISNVFDELKETISNVLEQSGVMSQLDIEAAIEVALEEKGVTVSPDQVREEVEKYIAAHPELFEGTGSVSWSDVTDKPENIVIDDNYIHTDNNYSDADKAVVSEVSERVSSLEEKVGSHTVGKDVPTDAVFTDTVYDDTEVRGLLANKANSGDVPTKLSELTNDSNYQSKAEIENMIADSIAAVEEKIPKNVSGLTNDSGYLTEVPSEYVTETEMSTALGSYALKSDIPQTEDKDIVKQELEKVFA